MIDKKSSNKIELLAFLGHAVQSKTCRTIARAEAPEPELPRHGPRWRLARRFTNLGLTVRKTFPDGRYCRPISSDRDRFNHVDEELSNAKTTMLYPLTGRGMTALLQAAGVGRRFGAPRHAGHPVSNVSLRPGRGEALGLAGESGSDSSTLGRLLLALLPPTQGGDPLNRGTLPRRPRCWPYSPISARGSAWRCSPPLHSSTRRAAHPDGAALRLRVPHPLRLGPSRLRGGGAELARLGRRASRSLYS